MKKNLRNALILALGLITTGVFAQDWNGDSRTRIDMSGEDGKFSTEQRATLGVTWGDSDWGIHVSTVANYTLGYEADMATRNTIDLSVYEAYASANLFGVANMTIGRQALEYGSGTILGKNDWAANRNTQDGAIFSVENDLLNLDLGVSKQDWGMEDEMSLNRMFVNLNKAGDNWSMNLLYGTGQAVALGNDAGTSTNMGLDLGYSMGAFNIGVEYNTQTIDAQDGVNDAVDGDMMVLSVGYAVNDNLSLSGSRTSYGENGFTGTGGNTGDWAGGTLWVDTVALTANWVDNNSTSWMSHGNMGHLAPEDVAMTLGVDYNMGAFTISGSYSMISNEGDDTGITRDGMTWDEWERTVMDFGMGYNLNDNASMSLRYVTDAIAENDAEKMMWLGLQITP